jgi:hypothetical protein
MHNLENQARRTVTIASIVLGLGAYALMPVRALAQGSNDPLANIPKLLQVLNKNGFEALQGQFRIIDPVPMACAGNIPSTWYNNVQPYMTAVLPGAVDEPNPSIRWEKTKRTLPVTYLLRQDEALVVVGSTPPPMAYFSFQTFLFGTYNPASFNYDPATRGFFRPYEVMFAYVGDTVNSLTLQTTGSTSYNRPMAFISTGNRQTQEQIRAALHAAGYADAIINTETLPPSLLRFGYDNADQFLFLWRSAIAVGGDAAMKEYQYKVADPNLSPVRVFRVRPKTEFPSNPLPAPVLRTRGTGHTEMDLYPTMQKLRQAILARYGAAFNAEQLDTSWPDSPDFYPEGYPAIQRDTVYLGPGHDGSGGYGRDANYRASSWFELGPNDFAMIYGVDHAATGKATYSSASVYLDQTLAAGVSSADSGDFAAYPGTASFYLPGEPGIDKFYVWKVARNCNGERGCIDARLVRPQDIAACAPDNGPAKIAPDAPVRIAFRQYAEPSTKVGPADTELLYERVIVFRPK